MRERRQPRVDVEPARRRVVSAWCRSSASDAVRALGDDHRRLQRVLRVLRRAVHARSRADAAAGGHPGRGPRRRRDRTRRSAAARTDRESLPGARRSVLRLRRVCSSASATFAGIERIRFASPHPRHVTARLIEAIRDLPKVCKHLHLPVQSGSNRVLTAMRRRYTREQYLELVARASRGGARHRRSRLTSSWGFRGRPTRTSRRRWISSRQARYHSMYLVQVFGASEHAGGEADARRRAGGGEDTADHGAAGAPARDPDRALSASASGRRRKCSLTRVSGGTLSLAAARVATRW